MKKPAFLITCIMASVFQCGACDICGCGVGNYNPYMFPHLSKNFFSLSYQHSYYRTHFFENGTEFNNNEYYNTISLAAQFSPAKNIQLMAIIPFQSNMQNGTEGVKSLDRFGDILLLANYKLIDHTSADKKMRQALLAGAGIKLATGSYQFNDNNTAEVGNSHFQAGTGSTDYLLNIYYSLRYRKLGFSSGLNYKINTANKLAYKFGNRIQSVTQLKFIQDIGKISLIPSIGILAESMQEDRQDQVKVDANRTGGYNIQALAGIDFNTKKWALGINYSASLQQNLSSGQVNARPGVNIHLSLSL